MTGELEVLGRRSRFHFPFDPSYLEGQCSPLFGRAPEGFVPGQFLAELGDLWARNKARGFLATEDVIQLVVGTVPLGIVWVFAAAPRFATHIVLFGEAARVERAQAG